MGNFNARVVTCCVSGNDESRHGTETAEKKMWKKDVHNDPTYDCIVEKVKKVKTVLLSRRHSAGNYVENTDKTTTAPTATTR